MGWYITCELCGSEEKGMHPRCGCPERETATNIQMKKGATILEVFLQNDRHGLYLYEKLVNDGIVFFLRTCLMSMGSGEYEDYRKIVKVTEEEMEEAVVCADWPGLTDLSEDHEYAVEQDNEQDFEGDPRVYIFEHLSETTARFRPMTESDDKELAIPIRYLEEERENKASLGWDYSHVNEEGEYWTSSDFISKPLPNPFTCLPDNNRNIDSTTTEDECCSFVMTPIVCTATRRENHCFSHSHH
jgi:hypothetical protein